MWTVASVILSVAVDAQAMDADVSAFLLSVILYLILVGVVLGMLLWRVVAGQTLEHENVQEKSTQPIYIEESPRPTMFPSTSSSSVYGSVKRRPKYAHRAGSRRIPAHRRKAT